MVATLSAMKHLLQRNDLHVNLIFLYEGEAENQSVGFFATMQRIADDPLLASTWLPKVDLVFISNK